MNNLKQTGNTSKASNPQEKRYRELLRRTIIRLSLTYLAPFILLTVYFHLQSNRLLIESRQVHLRTIAEQQASTLDLFLRERVANLISLIDDPKFEEPPSSETMQEYLTVLKRSSDTFVDVGFFDPSGVQVAYAGPFPSLEQRNYSSEPWYMTLRRKQDNFIITDNYLGFRKKPHFTIGVSREIEGQYVVFRATLDPEKIYEYITSFEGSAEVLTSIVNKDGYYQVVTSHAGTVLEESSIIPPSKPQLGIEHVKTKKFKYTYAYNWLRTAEWALIVQWSQKDNQAGYPGGDIRIVAVSLVVILIIFVVIIVRSKELVRLKEESDQTKAQFEQAAKLATVGELASGIAHEINNPLAIISEEAGLVKDLMNQEYGEDIIREELGQHLDEINNAVFRCRDITSKLLWFVRQTDIQLRPYNVNNLVKDVIDGFLTREIIASDISIERDFAEDLPRIVTDANQLEQVFLNIIKNAMDAIGEASGKITITTKQTTDHILVAITDTGIGMTREQMDKIFMPFFTTKEVGKGTGLGLSVSYGIVKSLGGKILVESEPGHGSTFTIMLPVD